MRILRTFPHAEEWPRVERGEGLHLHLGDGRTLLDFTGGGTEHAVLGWSHPEVVEAIQQQATRITHVDVKFYSERNALELADLLVSAAGNGLDRVYFAGNSGSEACEAAMKLSFQVHLDNRRASKTWFIGREQSYHGISSDNLAFCDRPHLQMYAPFYPARRAKIAEHNEYRHRKAEESVEAYAERSSQALEQKIIELGPDNVAGFVAETMQGGLVGAVPASPGYWKAIRKICDRYNVHLILDEVWCGNGASGRYLCVDWDGVSPDFLFMAKLLGAGYAPISIVMMRGEIAEALENSPQQRLQHGSTYQSYTLGIAATLAVQRIVTGPGFLDSIDKKGGYIQDRLKAAFSGHPFFRNVRGRGLRQAMEIACPDMNGFTRAVAARMRQDGILIDGKWHRFLFAPAFIVETAQIDHMIERLATHFRAVAQNWRGS